MSEWAVEAENLVKKFPRKENKENKETGNGNRPGTANRQKTLVLAVWQESRSCCI